MTPHRIRERLRLRQTLRHNQRELREQGVLKSAKTHIISYDSGSRVQSEAANTDFEALIDDGYILTTVSREYHGIDGHYIETLVLEHR